MVGPNSFAKTICSICYEDLKPIVEDLQAISICGHVFHELCLQQWFGYCTNSKKQSCPVCKQGCSDKNVGRLYFQSIGDPNSSQVESERCDKDGDDECRELLRREVKRLEAKVSGLNSFLDLHKKDVKLLSDELKNCKEQLSKEVTLKNEALSQRECIQAMLQTKSSDLVKSNLECSTLKEKNLALVKEIAALKLVFDCNLEEDEMNLATVGNESNSQDAIAIGVLKKSLVYHNKIYKELIAKCKSSEGREDRSKRKLEKAKDKIVKLKTRVQELEMAIENKENELLRSLKASKKRNRDDVSILGVNKSTISSSGFKHPPVDQKGQPPTSVIDLDEEGNDEPSVVKEINNSATNTFKDVGQTLHHKEKGHDDCLSYDDELQKLKTGESLSKNSKEGFSNNCKFSQPADYNDEDQMQQPNHQRGLSGLADLRNDVFFDHSASKGTSGLGLQDIKQVQPSFKSTAETSSSVPLAEPGNRCFTGGLLGPDGGNRYLGKWCKRAQNNSLPGSTSDTNSLIAMGADGRGGTVKVLRSINQSNMDTKDSFVSSKRFKPGTKSSGLQSQGCRQIDHFFRKANN